MKTYLVTSHSNYSVLVLAKDEKSAINKANKLYKRDYDETREDFTAYDLSEYLKADRGEDFDAMPIMSWYAWEEHLRQNNIGGWHK